MFSVRVRFAPSPTGELHIGGARTALFNWLFARQNSGSFILRIDDTDTERSVESYMENIYSTLKWLGLDWDEGPGKDGGFGPYIQSRRLSFYTREAERLLGEDKAYHCFCSPGELEAGRDEARKKGQPFVYSGRCCNLKEGEIKNFRNEGRNPVVRVRTPHDGETIVEDIVRGSVSFQNQTLDDFIIVKSNGTPTYNFASVVDDCMMQISHIIRAEEHLSNTPRQLLLVRALGYPTPLYAHVPMILAPDRSKLSKRHGATSVQEFMEKGYLPEALINYLALLGWSPPGEEEIVPLERMVEDFSLERVNKTAAIYDVKKLTWLNGHYLRETELDRITSLALPFLQQEGFLNPEPSPEELIYLKSILDAMRDRIKTLEELPDAILFFYRDDFEYEQEALKKLFNQEGVAEILQMASRKLAGTEFFEKGNIQDALARVIESKNVSAARLNKPLRLALSGRTLGPELIDIISILGREKTVKRIDHAISMILELNK